MALSGEEAVTNVLHDLCRAGDNFYLVFSTDVLVSELAKVFTAFPVFGRHYN